MSKLPAKDQIKFVDPPPKGVEINCPICLGTLREPYLTKCCGNHFCEDCIEIVKAGYNKCPLCQAVPLKGMINKSLRRKLNELKVYCVHEKMGCNWIGNLGKLDEHLAIGQSDGECQFVMIKCTVYLCREKFLRKFLKLHNDNDCQYRQFQCVYCGYQSTLFKITSEHYDKCPEYPLHCPNNCCSKQTYPRHQLDTHLASCPEQEVDCTFSKLGCKEKFKRHMLQQHLSTNMLQHQLIMCKTYNSQNEMITLLQQEKKSLEEKVASLTEDMEDLGKLVKPKPSNFQPSKFPHTLPSRRRVRNTQIHSRVYPPYPSFAAFQQN